MDIMDMAAITSGLKGYLDSKRKGDLLAMEQKQTDVNAREALMKQQRLREQMITGQSQWERGQALAEEIQRGYLGIAKTQAGIQGELSDIRKKMEELALKKQQAVQPTEIEEFITKGEYTIEELGKFRQLLDERYKTEESELKARRTQAERATRPEAEELWRAETQAATELAKMKVTLTPEEIGARKVELKASIAENQEKVATIENRKQLIVDQAEYERLKSQELMRRAKAGEIPELEMLDAQITELQERAKNYTTDNELDRERINLAKLQQQNAASQLKLAEMRGIGDILANATNAKINLLELQSRILQAKSIPVGTQEVFADTGQLLQVTLREEKDPVRIKSVVGQYQIALSMMGFKPGDFEEATITKKGQKIAIPLIPTEAALKRIEGDATVDVSGITAQLDKLVMQLDAYTSAIMETEWSTEAGKALTKAYRAPETKADVVNGAIDIWKKTESLEQVNDYLNEHGATNEQIAEVDKLIGE